MFVSAETTVDIPKPRSSQPLESPQCQNTEAPVAEPSTSQLRF